MNELVMDTGYSFKISVKTHLFLQEVYDMDIEGVNYFIDDQKEPCGIVILRFKGLADLSRMDKIASKLGGEYDGNTRRDGFDPGWRPGHAPLPTYQTAGQAGCANRRQVPPD